MFCKRDNRACNGCKLQAGDFYIRPCCCRGGFNLRVLFHSGESGDLLFTLFYQVLVELQFSFLCFLVAQNYDSFEQWKHLVALLCTCVKAMSKFPNLFISFMADLHFQVQFTFSSILVLLCICRCKRFLKTSLLTLFLKTTSWYPA